MCRSCPVYKKVCQGYNTTTGEANGPVHVHMGNGGFEFTWFVPIHWIPLLSTAKIFDLLCLPSRMATFVTWHTHEQSKAVSDSFMCKPQPCIGLC